MTPYLNLAMYAVEAEAHAVHKLVLILICANRDDIGQAQLPWIGCLLYDAHSFVAGKQVCLNC